MNNFFQKLFKIIVIVLGATDTIFSIFIPSLLVLVILTITKVDTISSIILIIVGFLSTFYRAIEVGFLTK